MKENYSVALKYYKCKDCGRLHMSCELGKCEDPKYLWCKGCGVIHTRAEWESMKLLDKRP